MTAAAASSENSRSLETSCATCGAEILFFESHCSKCAQFHSFPNVRAATSEAAQLNERYKTATAGIDHGALFVIENLIRNTYAVLNLSVASADNILRGDKYRNYYQMIDAGLRTAAKMQHHSARQMVDARFFPNYHHNIICMALSPDGRGLSNYGPIALRIGSGPYLDLRSSLLEMNTYKFFDEHTLGERDQNIPPGYRSDWSSRRQLIVTKLISLIKGGADEAKIKRHLLYAGHNREGDDFIEVHVFCADGISAAEWSGALLQIPLATSDDIERWPLIQNSCVRRGMALMLDNDIDK